jgi:chorismate-pyruvate lyase
MTPLAPPAASGPASRPADDLACAAAGARAPVPDGLLALRAAAPVRHWLLHDGSLTDRIAAAFGPVTVTPTRQTLGRPTPFEAASLGRPPAGGWWIREIALAAGGRTRLRARTLVPPDAPRLRRRLRGLGATPLGRVLFRGDHLRPDVRRGRRVFVPAADGGGWIRCTAYTIGGEPLLVLERPLTGLLDAR